ncbi:M20/M25/M40 family metallo-hydrolase [Halobacterium noricense]|uniref:M20/M25/M40 family metallo-hydrolase n=1 Tax=Halobacterium noricense TaxID=223182 RepID=UPI001E4051DE|nr:M20/M25/M40 family metallo-hydrolase [Halobacterium noricense]UHH24475.1 M20/M25/M40 family metallo-hydrolase [Halobacterium noricense]
MDETRDAFLRRLLDAPSPSGFETAGQRAWVDYVEEFADDVRTDAYGNAVAVYDGGDTEVAFAGHADELGFVVTAITDDGFLRVRPLGGVDRSVTEGSQVAVHTDEGTVNGVVGHTAIHLREAGEDAPADVTEQHVDVGAEDGEQARELVEVGDPATLAAGVHDLAGTRIAGRGLDNRTGSWVAAEALRRAAERGADCTVYAVNTVQEELGTRGASMVAFDLDPDVALVVDVTHAADNPSYPSAHASEVELGGGPTVTRGGSSHPEVARAVRAAGDAEGIDVQVEAMSTTTGTDADTFFRARSGIPTVAIGIPNRYMHTPAEVVDTEDVEDAADLLAAFAVREADRESFAVDV